MITKKVINKSIVDFEGEVKNDSRYYLLPKNSERLALHFNDKGKCVGLTVYYVASRMKIDMQTKINLSQQDKGEE